jgi:pimeloyl-ACP methyl ester carboxylesterase
MATFESGGRTLHFSDDGTGPTVVLLHSSGMSHRQWRGHARALSAHARVLCPDLLGNGGSSALPVPFSVEDDAALVGAWVRTLGPDVRVGGHSYGGLVALHVARQQADRVTRLALYEPVAFGVLRGLSELRADFWAQMQTLTASPTGGDEAWLHRFVDYWQGPGAWAALSDSGRAMMLAGGQTAYHEVQTTAHRSVTADEVRAVNADTLVLCGSATQEDERVVVQRLVSLMPRARLQWVEGAGHMGPLTHGPLVGEALGRHLLGVDG